jgi:hypothetical protein
VLQVIRTLNREGLRPTVGEAAHSWDG